MTALTEAQAAQSELHASNAWTRWGSDPSTHVFKCGQHLDACIAALQPVSPPPPPPVPATGTYEEMTAYLDEPAPTDGTILTSVSAAVSAITAAKTSDVLIVDAGIVIPGEFHGFNHDAGGARVVFRPGAGFSGHSADRNAAVFLKGNRNWKVWGGVIMNPNGRGILQYATTGPFKWTGFAISDCGYTGIALYQTDADIVGVTYKGRGGSRVARLEWDSHPEKGTGIHAANIADVNDTLHYLRDSTIALDVANQGTGAALEVQQDRCAGGVVLWCRATNLGFPVPASGGYSWAGYAKQQVSGNVFQIWDRRGKGNLVIKGAWADTIMGRIVETNGAYGDLSGVKVEYGRGVKTLQAAGKPGAAISGPPNYAKKNGLVLGSDCQPLP